MRQMTPVRRLSYFLLKPAFSIFLSLLWASCRIKPIIGEEHLSNLAATDQAIIPCYWHQRQIFCIYYMFQLIKKGLKIGFLISPSVDGEIPASFAKKRGAHVVRGSHTRTGARAMRELFQLINQTGISPVNTPDGPLGPVYHFKAGTVMLAQLTQAPIIPISYAAEKAFYLKTWDRFMIPKPFSHIQIVVAAPIYVAKKLSTQELEIKRQQIEDAMLATDAKAEQYLSTLP
ncbi:MAG: lysophospholipid acyltransferase family protein [Gammaproteobacteria bacterium]|nr:lysophospholipid acyltransferase family protein [Gammaproteobacteria bacterium]